MKIKAFICSAAFFSLFFCTPAMADWTASFQPPATADSPLRIDLPDNLDVMTMAMLAAELDGIDITALLAMDGNDFLYTPPQPLETGEHLLRLVVLNGDGTTSEKGRWNFTVSGGGDLGNSGTANASPPSFEEATEQLRRASFRADTLTEISIRAGQDNLPGGLPHRTIASGAGDLNAMREAGSWNITSNLNYLLQSDRDLSLTGNEFDLGEYAVRADYLNEGLKGGVVLGHHDIGLQSNLFSGFYRRGASARLGDAEESVTGTVFSFRPETSAGAAHLTGLDDHDNRLQGMAVSVKPFSKNADALKVTGIYYNGRGIDGGTALSENDAAAKGSGWGAVMEKSFRRQSIKLRGEYARSQFDQDGNNGAAPEDGSDAFSLSLEARPFESMFLKGQSADLVLGARYDRIDTFFDSLANPGLAGDRDAVSAYGNFTWGAFAAGAEISYETNNVDDLANMATDRLRRVGFHSSYAFPRQEGEKAWMGTPYWTFSGFVSDGDRMETPLGYNGFDTDYFSDSYTAGLGSAYDSWYWSFSHTVSRFDDFANATHDTTSNFSSFSAGWVISPRFEVNGALQTGHLRDKDLPSSNFDTNFLFAASAKLIPDKLHARMDYNLNLAAGTGDTPDRHLLNSEVEYTVLKPDNKRPGLAIALRGSMEDRHGNTNNAQNDTAYQLFTVLRIKAPVAFGN